MLGCVCQDSPPVRYEDLNKDELIRRLSEADRVAREYGMAQKALRESEERLRALVQASSDVVYRMSPDWTEMRQLIGRDFIADTEAPSRTGVQKYIHPDDQPGVTAAIQEAIRTKSVFEVEHRVLRADGSVGWTFSRAIPILDADGEITEWFGMASDITDHKAAEERLRASEGYMRLALEASSAASWAWDVVSGEIVWDDNFRRIYGFPPGSKAGWDDWVERLHPDDRAAVMGRLDEVLQTPGDDEWNRDFRILRPDGQVVWMQGLGRAERDAEGHATRLTGINLDISRRKATEEALGALTDSLEQQVAERTAKLDMEIAQRQEAEVALRASEARLRTIFQRAPIGITQANPADGRLLMVNPAYCAIVGYSEAELTGRPIAEITHPQDRAADQEGFRQLIAREINVYTREKRYVRKDGGIVWVGVNVALVRDADGRPMHTVAMVTDITELRRAEEAAREHLEEASRLQRLQTANELATLLAHELNQPLATIATYAEVGEQLLRKPSPDPDEVAANLKRISQQALRAGGIIRHLRSLVSRRHVDPMPMDLNEVVRNACDLLAPQARRSAIRLEMQLDPRLPPLVGVDVQVEQVLLNLLQNAFDAIQDAGMEGGTVTVQTRWSGDMVRVTVSDSGPGIDAASAVALFEPLASQKAHGLGVGLRISRSLIEAHGGRLWVEPRVPGGVFHFELPLEP